jgi:ribonuclease HI
VDGFGGRGGDRGSRFRVAGGHASHADNNRYDELATEAADRVSGRG